MNKPEIRVMEDGSKVWDAGFYSCHVKVYVPEQSAGFKPELLNYGFEAPYVICLAQKDLSDSEAIAYAKSTGLEDIAKIRCGSVVFVSPNCKGGWANAGEGIFEEIIANSKLHQYHENGMVSMINRFTHGCDGYAIRGAIFRTYLFGENDAADYIAEYLLKTVNGAGLWGPADVTPAGVVLKGLSRPVNPERRDIPIVSLGNSDEINTALRAGSDFFYSADEYAGENEFYKVYNAYVRKHYRWCGTLCDSVDFEAMGMSEDFGAATVKTTPDNRGDFSNTENHEVGYIAFYNKEIMEKSRSGAQGGIPLVVAFHGGGDSAMYIAEVSEWWRVAKDHDFLLVCMENHLNQTASETVEFIQEICRRYPVDPTKIYASGFSMGGCKSWDLYQEYPEVFAGIAPMDATFEVGDNAYGDPAPKPINRDCLVPIFYVGGEQSPLPELPFQAKKNTERAAYVTQVNRTVKEYNVTFEDRENWPEKIQGIAGDETKEYTDNERNDVLTVHYYKSVDGNVYTAFGSVRNQAHECRHHTCDQAWLFLSRFSRRNGKIVID